MEHRSIPELILLVVVIVLFAPIIHETLTNSNFYTNTFYQLMSLKCHKLKSLSQEKYFADYFTDWHNILSEDVHAIYFVPGAGACWLLQCIFYCRR